MTENRDGVRGGAVMDGVPSRLRYWLAAFVLTLFLGLFVQWLLLPHIAPQYHEGHGLASVSIDGVKVHANATELAQRIQQEGWGVWRLRYEKNSANGLVAAVYALTLPEPWVVLPILAFCHATTALLLMEILLLIGGDRRFAFWGSLPFLLFPSTLSWTSQLLKDAPGNLAIMLFFYAWTVAARPESWQRFGWRVLPWAGLAGLAGGGLSWVIRPYQLKVLSWVALMILVPWTLHLVWSAWRGKGWQWRNIAWFLILMLGMQAVFFPLTSSRRAFPVIPRSDSQVKQERAEFFDFESPPPLPMAPRVGPTAKKKTAKELQALSLWQKTPLIPRALERQLEALAYARQIYLRDYVGASSNVDTEVVLDNATAVFGYLPRALHVALFSPFPSHWFEQGGLSGGGIFRKISGGEMVGVYGGLLLLLAAFLRFFPPPVWWSLVAFCLIPLTLLGVSVPNLGTLYRLRYGYLMVLVGMGIAAWPRVRAEWLRRSSARQS